LSKHGLRGARHFVKEWISMFSFLSAKPGHAARCGFLLGLLMLLPQQPAWADLMLHPTRVVFEKNQRAAQVELMNSGSKPETYRISLVNRRMTETGQLLALDSPAEGEQVAQGMLRYSPRQVTLAPGVGQTVRILLRRPADLAAGEYRSHLQFDRLPDPAGASSIESRAGLGAQEIGVVLTALVGASIPIIVRHGETAASVNLADLALTKPADGSPAVVSIRIERRGNRSVYGDIAISFTPRGGVEQVLAKASGVAVYTPLAARRASLVLRPPSGMALADGTLRASYRERPPGGGTELAEAVIALP
jgi:hypothetical protein